MSSSHYISHRRLRKPVITAIDEVEEPDQSGERSSKSSRNYIPNRQLLTGVQAAHAESEPNIAITREYSFPTPVARSYSVDNGPSRSHDFPGTNNLNISSNNNHISNFPRRNPPLRSNSTPNANRDVTSSTRGPGGPPGTGPGLDVANSNGQDDERSWDRQSINVDSAGRYSDDTRPRMYPSNGATGQQIFDNRYGRPSLTQPQNDITYNSALQVTYQDENLEFKGTKPNWQPQKTEADYSDNDPRYSPYNESQHPPSTRTSFVEWQDQPRFTNPQYTQSNGNAFTHSLQQQNFQSMGEYPDEVVVNRLSGFRIDYQEEPHPTQPNTARYFQEISPRDGTTTRDNFTASSDSRYSTEDTLLSRMSNNSCEDYMGASDRPLNDIQSFQVSERAKRAFEEDVLVWQDERQMFVKMLFDTQCHESNWVSRDVVAKLKAGCFRLLEPAEFQVFNGQTMQANSKVVLFFSKNGGKEHQATFFVASDDVPFDLLLGADDCLHLKLIKPVVLGLLARKQNKREVEETKVDIANFNVGAEAHERRRKEKDKGRDKAKKKEDNNLSYKDKDNWKK